MTPLLRKLLAMNWLIVSLAILLSSFGVIAVYSATYFRPWENYWEKQAIWVVGGLGVFVVCSILHYRWVKWAAVPLYVVGTILTALTYTSLGQEHGGAKCWLRVPGIGTFQPSQLALVAAILTVGLFLCHFRKMQPMLKLLCVSCIVVSPMLLTLKQPDFGMTLVWIPVMMGMLFAGGLPKRHLIAIILIGLCLLPLVMNFGLKPYQRARLVTFIYPEIDPQGSSYAINQALIAIGSGGFEGKGFKAAGTQVEQGFIPGTTVHTDYIFTAIAEQWGFLGSSLLVAAFSALLVACLYSAFKSADDFGLVIACGFTMQLFFHVYQNIGMTIAIMPITGLPLPLISYGGTFLLMIMFSLGIINSIWVHRKEMA
ncbi:MAG: Rod shape-determining protein RodA [Verrucomicrobiota bacterium]|jgi:rod shape determining protein RodA